MLAFLLLSRENRWSSKSHHACMFGRVVTEVNAVRIRPMGQIFPPLFQQRARKSPADPTLRAPRPYRGGEKPGRRLLQVEIKLEVDGVDDTREGQLATLGSLLECHRGIAGE